MARVDRVLTGFAKSNVGQKFYKNMVSGKNDKIINVALPLVEASVASAMAMTATAINPKIEKEQKQSLMIQSGLRWGISVFLAGGIAKKFNNFADDVVKQLDPKLIPQAKKVANGLKVGIPMVNTVLISRFLTPVFLIPVSSKIRDKINNKKLDVKG